MTAARHQLRQRLRKKDGVEEVAAIVETQVDNHCTRAPRHHRFRNNVPQFQLKWRFPLAVDRIAADVENVLVRVEPVLLDIRAGSVGR